MKKVDMTKLMRTLKREKALMLQSSSKSDRYNIADELSELLVSGDTNRILRYNMKKDTIYDDTIGGLRFANGKWIEVDGVMKMFLDKVANDRDNNYVLIVNDIDEVDNLGSAFDLVLGGMEQRNCVYRINNGKFMMVSSNVYIIATATEWEVLDLWTINRFPIMELEVQSYE